MDKREREVLRFPSKKFCLTVPKNFVGEPFSVSIISGIEKFYASEGYVTIFCRNFLSRSTEKLCRGTLLCCVSESFRYGISLWIRRGEYQNFPSKIFCLTVPKNFVGEPFSVSLISGIGKNLCFRGLCHDFPSKIFCLTVPKHFVEEPFYAVFQKISGGEKVYG